MGKTKLHQARGQFAVFFNKLDPDTMNVNEAGVTLFNSLSQAKEFAEGVREYPNRTAQIYMAIGTDYNNTSSEKSEELFI